MIQVKGDNRLVLRGVRVWLGGEGVLEEQVVGGGGLDKQVDGAGARGVGC